jgi:AraC-like DNA-binding protein
MRRVVVTADTESTLALLAEIRGAVRIHGRDGRGGMRLEQDRVGPVTIDRTVFDVDLDADVGPVDTLVFGQVTAGAVGFRTDRGEHWHRDGVYLSDQPGRPRTSMIRGGTHDQVIIDPVLPCQIANAEPGRTGQPVRFTGYEPISPRAARAWQDAYAYVRGHVLSSPGSADHELIAANAAHLLAAVTLTVFPNTAMTADYLPGPGWVPPADVHRAAGFIDAMADGPVTLDQIATVAGASGRALQHAFRGMYGTTPLGYLRRVRLERAHAQLQSTHPGDGTTVAAVARTWGWANPARFAAAYRQRFGISPSRTLRG